MGAFEWGGMDYLAVSFYKLICIDDPQILVEEHKKFFSSCLLTGRIYVSTQGINAQFSGLQAEVAQYLQWLRSDPRFADIVVKAQPHHEHIFPRMTIKVRPELVALGCEVDLSKRGISVDPQTWRQMLEGDEHYLKLDVRNDYEWDVGHFEGFERPNCETFRDFRKQAQELKERYDPKQTQVMMCCTGGIRCEIYSALLLQEGFEKIYQLDGGILSYATEEGGKHWKGKLFVFDDRLAVDINSEQIVGKCHSCSQACDTYYNCANMDCNELFLSCPRCLELRGGCCQERCQTSLRIRPFDHQLAGKPFRKWYTYFKQKDAPICTGT